MAAKAGPGAGEPQRNGAPLHLALALGLGEASLRWLGPGVGAAGAIGPHISSGLSWRGFIWAHHSVPVAKTITASFGLRLNTTESIVAYYWHDSLAGSLKLVPSLSGILL